VLGLYAVAVFPLTKLMFSLLTLQVVLSCVKGSPAARAGIHEGDELIEINGIFLVNISYFSLYGSNIFFLVIQLDETTLHN